MTRLARIGCYLRMKSWSDAAMESRLKTRGHKYFFPENREAA